MQIPPKTQSQGTKLIRARPWANEVPSAVPLFLTASSSSNAAAFQAALTNAIKYPTLPTNYSFSTILANAAKSSLAYAQQNQYLNSIYALSTGIATGDLPFGVTSKSFASGSLYIDPGLLPDCPTCSPAIYVVQNDCSSFNAATNYFYTAAQAQGMSAYVSIPTAPDSTGDQGSLKLSGLIEFYCIVGKPLVNSVSLTKQPPH